MNKFIKITTVLLMVIVTNTSYAQTFSEYYTELTTLPCPKKFRSVTSTIFVEKDLPNYLFDQIKHDLTIGKAKAKLGLDINYPLILIKYRDLVDYSTSSVLYSFDSNGVFLSYIAVSHSADGEGVQFSITPENKIRIASYGASDAVINTYRYESGQFIKEGEIEYGDADNLPDY